MTLATNRNDDELLDINQVAELLKVGTKTITNWVSTGRNGFPSGFKMGTGRCSPRRWWKSEIIQYVETLSRNAE